MKSVAVLALAAPLLVAAAPAPFEEPILSQRAVATGTPAKFDAFVPGTKVPFPSGDGWYVGQDNSTHASLFQFKDGSVHQVSPAQGNQLTYQPLVWNFIWKSYGSKRPMGVNSNGLCYECTDGSTKGKRSVVERGTTQHQERTLGLLLGLIALKFKILGAIIGIKGGKCFNWGDQWQGGCLNQYPGNIWIGGDQCNSGDGGYVQYPCIPNIGWDNGCGGSYCGDINGVQYWQWQDGSVAPLTIDRGNQVGSCWVDYQPTQPPVCNSCYDPNSDYWQSNRWDASKTGYSFAPSKRAQINELN